MEETRVAISGNGADSADVSEAESRRLICVPADKRESLESRLRAIQKLRGRALFVLISQMIDEDVCKEVYRWRKELESADAEDLDVLIHSPGGSLNACYRTARFIANHTDDWQALVPAMAASGATMICLGSSLVVMGEMAQLGPIDPQVLSRRHERFFTSERQSPLESFQAMKYLREYSLTSLDAGMSFLLEHDVNPHVALETAGKLAMDMIKPVLAKVEPYDLGSFALDSNLATAYCRRISDPSDPEMRTQRNVQYRSLVEDYPAHEFIIDIEEARTLGFYVTSPVDPLGDIFDQLREELDGVHTCVGLLGPTEREGAS